MTLRILFTLAILAGLAVAPDAQSTFRWQAGGQNTDERVGVRLDERISQPVERAIERVTRSMERSWDRDSTRWARQWDRQWERQADHAVHATREHRSSFANGQGGGSTDPCDDTGDRDHDNDQQQFCETRDEALPAGPLTVDAAPNGGITVEGWDKNEIRVQAIIRTYARTEAQAKNMAAGVQIRTGSGHISATGPDRSGREWWSVSYRVSVPRKNDLTLNTQNGGITIARVAGRLAFDTSNGGVKLTDVGGDVRGRTHNGGLSVALGGDRWDGEGLDVETTNGGVTLTIPEGYNAELITRTQNGGFRTDYPMTITGELNSRQGMTTTLGAGGAPVRVRTTNGGLRVTRR